MKSKKLGKHIDFDKEGIEFPDKTRLWDGIEPFLLTDNLYTEKNRESLLNAIDELPIINPSQNIWFKLSGDIKSGETIHSKRLVIRWAAGIAATLLMVILLYPIYKTHKLDNTTETTDAISQCGQDLKVNEFLTQLCLDYPNKCTNSDFLELKNEILTLQLEKEGLQKQVFYNTGDATIHDLCNRIDDQINFLKKQMESYVSL